jgi:alkylhydroperoxidase/carboxymuconolactone decarboxylase family protein YurZ
MSSRSHEVGTAGSTYAGVMDPRTRRFVTLAVLVSLVVVVVVAALRG